MHGVPDNKNTFLGTFGGCMPVAAGMEPKTLYSCAMFPVRTEEVADSKWRG